MMLSRWTVGFQDAFRRFIEAPERGNQNLFTKKEFQVNDTPPPSKAPKYNTPIRNELPKYSTPVRKEVPKHSTPINELPLKTPAKTVSDKKKPGRPRKSDTPPDNTDSTKNHQEVKLNTYSADNSSISRPTGQGDIGKWNQNITNPNKRRHPSENSSHKKLPPRKRHLSQHIDEELKDKDDSKSILKTNEIAIDSDSNGYATKCPHCNFWKLNSALKEHVKICQNSTNTAAPFESLLSTVSNLQSGTIEETVPTESQEENSGTENEAENKSLINFASQLSTKRTKARGDNKAYVPVPKDVDLREFYFDRPKRKAHNVALQSCKDILTEEAKGKEEDFNFYKRMPKNSMNTMSHVVSQPNKISRKMSSTSEEYHSSDGEDEVNQLASELIKNWDSKDLMTEVFDIKAASGGFQNRGKKVAKSKAKNESNSDKKMPCNFCKSAACNDTFGIKNCLSCNYISYRKCDLERHIKEEHKRHFNVSNHPDKLNDGRISPEQVTKAPIQDMFHCNSCQYSTHNRKDFKRHMVTKRHLETKQHMEIKKHVETKKQANIVRQGVIETVKASNSNNDKMVIKKHPENLYSCKECNFTAENESTLTTHLIIYH